MVLHDLDTSSGTTSSGAWSTTTHKFSGSLLRQLFIDFTTASTTFNFTLTDDKDREIIRLTGITQTLNYEVQLPLKGIYTLTISSASADEAFKFLFRSQDL